MKILSLVLLVAACTPDREAATAQSGACPDAVTRSIHDKFPGTTIASCKPEKNQFEVKLDGEKKLEVDMSPTGDVLQTESIVTLPEVPEKVMAAFTAKYPGAKAARAEKQVRTGKGTFYELKLEGPAKVKEATFAEDGAFVDEE